MELLTARGPQNASRIASEFKAGVKYFDAFIGGSGTYESLVYDGMVEPLLPNLILPEVKEEKYWWVDISGKITSKPTASSILLLPMPALVAIGITPTLRNLRSFARLTIS